MIVDSVIIEIVNNFGLFFECVVCGGIIDSIVVFIVSGVNSFGEVVIFLGLILVLKLLSYIRVDNSKYGIYSYCFGNLWLVGGVFNIGGVVL